MNGEALGSAAWRARVKADYERQTALIPEGFRHVAYMEFGGYSLALHSRLVAAGDLLMLEPGYWVRRIEEDSE